MEEQPGPKAWEEVFLWGSSPGAGVFPMTQDGR